MANIYLSYRLTDRPLAMDLASRMQSAGHKVTIDVDAIVPGQDWRTALQEGLARSDCVIVLLSREALSSSHFVLSEIGAARALGKVLLPVLVGNVEVPPIVSDVFCISYRDDNLDEVVQQLNRAIAKLANKNVFIVHGQSEAKNGNSRTFFLASA